jgi:hypothetical protein
MAHSKKNILLFNPSFSAGNMYLPYFWATAKTYYERNGLRVDEYNWINPLFNFYNNIEEIKKFTLSPYTGKNIVFIKGSLKEEGVLRKIYENTLTNIRY